MHKCRRANTKYNTTVLSIQTSYLRHEHGMEHNSFRLMKKKSAFGKQWHKDTNKCIFEGMVKSEREKC